jgi:heme-degrading monooxygenase HmoA
LPDAPAPPLRTDAFVAFSELTVPVGGRDDLEAAFADRLGAVDRWPGFRGLEVWADEQDPTRYVR